MSFDELRERLLSFDIQASAPRLAIADFVLHTDEHPTAEEVKAAVEKRMPSVSLATIYNTLNLFVQKGLIKTIRDPQSEKFRYDCNIQPHFHFYDENTGKLLDIDPKAWDLQNQLAGLGSDLEIREVDIVFRGQKKSTPKVRDKS
jgi:Fe2+ or Zn2+ uptake regulation protein